MTSLARDPLSLAFQARGVAGLLREERAADNHEDGDRIEDDFATTARIIWQSAGPILRRDIEAITRRGEP
jgi:hypothetical protein